jgi:hypothetical protein
MTLTRRTFVLTALCACAAACSDDAAQGTGRVRLFLESEETITEGLEPGSELENIRDGWTVAYDKLLLVAGKVRARSNESDAALRENAVYLVDLTQLSESGFELLAEDEADAVRYDDVSFTNPIATDSLKRTSEVDDADRALMVDHGWSIFISGTLTKPDGESCAGSDCTPQTSVRLRGATAPHRRACVSRGGWRLPPRTSIAGLKKEISDSRCRAVGL